MTGASIQGFRALLRLALREIRRHPARSALVFALIALMVATSTAAATVMRTMSDSPEDRAVAGFGDAVARIDIYAPTEPAAPGLTPELIEIDSAALRTTVESFTGEGTAEVVRTSFNLHVGDTAVGPYSDAARLVDVSDLELGEAGLTRSVRLVEGRAASGPDEIVMSAHQMTERGLIVGDTVSIERQQFTVVGIVAKTVDHTEPVAVVTPEGFDRLPPSDPLYRFGPTIPVARVYLSSLGPETVADQQLFQLSPRIAEAVREQTGSEHVSTVGRDWVPDFRPALAPDQRPEQLGTLLAAVLAVQVALVAAAAFAVGVRRRTRDFGQLLVTGADHRQVRMLVLIEAAGLGVIGALVGAIGGVLVPWMLHTQGVLERLTGRDALDLQWSLIDWFGPFVIGVIAALAAAWWPTQRLRRLSPSAALSDHLPVEPATVRSAGGGLAAILVGTMALALLAASDWVRSGTDYVGPLMMLGAVLCIFFGAIALIGNLIGWFGRRADRLSVRPRLVIRNSARHQARSWMAVGAFVATMAFPVVLGSSVKAYPGSYSNASAVADRWVSVDVGLSASRYVHIGAGGVSFSPSTAAGADRGETPAVADLEVFQRSMAPMEDLDGFRSTVTWDTLAASVGIGRPGPNSGWDVEAIGPLAIASPELADALGVDREIIANLGPDAALVVGVDPDRFVPGAEQLTIAGRPGSDPGSDAPTTDLWIERAAGSRLVRPSQPWILVSEAVGEVLDLEVVPGGAAWEFASRPSKARRADVFAIANQAWTDAFGSWEPSNVAGRNPSEQSPYRPLLFVGADPLGPSAESVRWLSIAIPTFIAALISLVTAALAAVELDKEIGSMIASGASPTIRRWLLGAQTTYHLGLAAVIGIPLGVLLFWAATRADINGPQGLVFPWASMAVMGIVVPVAVGVVVMVLFRNGRPAVSRRLS